MKKLLLLGGSRYLLPAIKAAHEVGAYVITADYLPENIAHKFSDEYRNVSIVDRDAVLAVARQLQVNGILSYATDPGVATAAYVAEKMGLPTSPYESVALLQNKGKFRSFLREHGFNTPYAKSFRRPQDAIAEADTFAFPVIVKPVDSAGSKGVRKVETIDELESAAQYSLTYSLTDEFIVEEFIEKTGFSSDTDSFSIHGKLVFCSFNNQWFDLDARNPYTPAGYLWPSSMPTETQRELRAELQRLMTLLRMDTTLYNVETRLGVDGKAYIMECTPRAGGNRHAEILRMASGQDLIMASVKAALGMVVENTFTDPVYHGHWGEIVLHSNTHGSFKGLEIEENLRENCVAEVDLWVNPGDEVRCFTGANEAIGTIVLRCESEEELTKILTNADDFIKVHVEDKCES